MSKVSFEVKDTVAVVRLNNGAINPISLELLDDLIEAVGRAREEALGLVLAGGAKFFSMGFDLPALLEYDQEGMTDFFERFNQACLALYTLPMPTVAAIVGHAVAGGTVLSLTCDYRLAASGKTKMGLNEVRIGVPVPFLTDLMLRQIVGDRAATQIAFAGEFMTPDQCLALGLIDEVHPQEEVEAKALAKVGALAALPRSAQAANKANRIEAVRYWYERSGRRFDEIFIKTWFEPETQELLVQAAEKF